MAALTPPGSPPGRTRGSRPRHRVRLRRAIPAFSLILGLSVLAGLVWMRVLDQVDAGATAVNACDTRQDGVVDPHRVQVRVYNGTDREGLARRVGALLSGRGFAVVATANDPLIDIRPVRGSAEVRYGPKGAKQADLVRRQVPGALLYRDIREDAVVDLALGPGFRRLATAAELAKGRGGQGLRASATVPAALTC